MKPDGSLSGYSLVDGYELRTNQLMQLAFVVQGLAAGATPENVAKALQVIADSFLKGTAK